MKTGQIIAVLFLIIVVALAVFLFYRPGGSQPSGSEDVLKGTIKALVKNSPNSIHVTVPSFKNRSRIPTKYTCDGADVSPEINIGNVPSDAKSIAIIMYDPDAPSGIFYHWGLYNIPPSTAHIPEGLPESVNTDYGLQLRNSFGGIGYGGACPPKGHGTHRYVILVLALDTTLDLPPYTMIPQFIDAAKTHVIAYGVYIGLYSR